MSRALKSSLQSLKNWVLQSSSRNVKAPNSTRGSRGTPPHRHAHHHLIRRSLRASQALLPQRCTSISDHGLVKNEVYKG
ncbi:hypothetical protein BU25DRAFT_406017 [Macroventuria anomochaeta]|uniref:Uncharacterized protein n=1 Tax=Macroventuria anomochaeta TaxID=301207 RepID=A0ACB6SGT6_9PLEO|nr:uncharacterized protein BU25DRAFT_406017 [Macroventuria anomochaeta]KAF2632697.1 hypothetical protein BU25DRAFT_406017 [Macroventuria anomochaeta]